MTVDVRAVFAGADPDDAAERVVPLGVDLDVEPHAVASASRVAASVGTDLRSDGEAVRRPVSCGPCQNAAVSRSSSARVRSATGPVPSVVRSSVASWMVFAG